MEVSVQTFEVRPISRSKLRLGLRDGRHSFEHVGPVGHFGVEFWGQHFRPRVDVIRDMILR